ncbi:phage portal protein [Leisingera sp. F5]|uniref:phage portal protein n=1 Tax=Leisingera sp. F5 TaxID=1813816 RepID=UPI000ACF0A95|nr:phage portal protein [Leisingera sp. F5]
MFFKKKRRAASAAAASAVSDPQAEARAADDVQRIASSDPGIVAFFGGAMGITDEVVTVQSALKVPSVLAAVSFLSRTMAGLPLKVYGKGEKGRKALPDDPVSGLLNRAANDETSALEWRRGVWQDVLTSGRHISFIERDGRGKPINLWPLDVSKVTVERRQGRTLYHYQDGTRRVTYAASEVLDLCFMSSGDRLSSYSPVYNNADTIGLAMAVTRYGARFFKNGGIPPFTLSGPIKTPGGVHRASNDLTAAVKDVAEGGGNAITVPEGHTLTPLGLDPEKMQMVEVKRFLVEEIARIYGLPPVFLQDLTHGTFSNTEQQDLHLVKHLVAQWAAVFEAEANLKLWGRDGGEVYAEHVLDGLMRGDLKTRVDAAGRRIATGQTTINEEREIENRPPVTGGGQPLVQGAMVPVTLAGAHVKQTGTDEPAAVAASNEGQEND